MNSTAVVEVLLSEEDQQHLQDKGYEYTVAQAGGFVCVLIKGFGLAPSYAPRSCDLLIRLPPNFPMAKPDCFWTNPHVRLTNGGYPIRADVFNVNYDGRDWQQWSRHLDAAQWRPGKDNLRTFLGIIRRELQEGV